MYSGRIYFLIGSLLKISCSQCQETNNIPTGKSAGMKIKLFKSKYKMLTKSHYIRQHRFLVFFFLKIDSNFHSFYLLFIFSMQLLSFVGKERWLFTTFLLHLTFLQWLQLLLKEGRGRLVPLLKQLQMKLAMKP